MSSIAKNSLYNLLGSLVSSLLVFVGFVVLSRLLETELLGIFHMEFLVINMASIFFISFIDYALIYYLGKSDSLATKQEFFLISLLISYVIGFCVVVSLYWLVNPILSLALNVGDEYMMEARKLFFYFLFYFFILIFFNNVKSVLIAQDKFRLRFRLIFLHRFFIATLPVFFYLYFRTLSSVSLGYFIAALFSFAFSLYIAFGEQLICFRRLSLSRCVEFLRYGKNSFLINASNQTLSWADTFFIAFFHDPYQVGLYSVVYRLFSELSQIPKMVSEGAFPKMISATQDSLGGVVDLVKRYISFFQIPLSLFLIFFSSEIVKMLYGVKYEKSAFPFLILAISLLFSHYWIANLVLLSVNKPQLVAKSLFYSVIASLIFNLLLIPRLGIIGAALGTLFSVLMYYGISWFMWSRENMFRVFFVKDFRLVMFTIFILFILKIVFIETGGLMYFVVMSICFVVFYSLALFFGGFLSDNEKRVLGNLLRFKK